MTAYDCGAEQYLLKSLDGWNVCMEKVLFDDPMYEIGSSWRSFIGDESVKRFLEDHTAHLGTSCSDYF